MPTFPARFYWLPVLAPRAERCFHDCEPEFADNTGESHQTMSADLRFGTLGSGSIANDAAGVDVKGRVAGRHPRLVAEAPDEAQEAPNVGKVRGHADGCANGAGALLVPVLHHARETVQIDVRPQCEPRPHVFLGQPFGDLARAGVAEAPGAQRNPGLPGQFLDAAVVEQVSVRIVEIERHGPATRQ